MKKRARKNSLLIRAIMFILSIITIIVLAYFLMEPSILPALFSPTEMSCEDSDANATYTNGKNYNLKGTAVSSTASKEDSCDNSDSNYLREYICVQGNIVEEIYNCRYEGKVCLDGRCTAPCADSDVTSIYPDGRNIYLKGTSASIKDGSGTDQCDNSSVLKEYVCFGNSLGTVQVTCFSGMVCHDGKCIRPSDIEENCTPNWNCSWSECINKNRMYICTDINNCGSDFDRPQEKQESCSINNNSIPSSSTTSKKFIENSYAIWGVVILLVIIAVLLWRYSERPR